MPRLRPSNSSVYAGSPAPGPSSVAPSPSGNTTQNTVPLPEYEDPSFPLTSAARDKLAILLNQYPSQKLNTYCKTASDGLISHVDEINLLYRESLSSHERRNTKRARDGESGEDESADIGQLSEKVDRMTERMETSVRKCIDAQAKVDAVNKALREVQGNAQRASTQATQATAAVTQDGEENDENTQRPDALRTAFDDSLQKHTDLYGGKTAKLRYKEHDWFKNFKSAAYYAKYGDEGKPMDPNTWFADASAPQPGETARVGDDEDFEEMGQRISTKCPLTLQEFKEPVTSKKCPHSFEKGAIMDFLKNIRPPTRGRNANWVADMECPVPGCDSRLTKDDLEDDIRLKTLIKRKQRQEELARRQAEEEDEDRHRQERNGTRVEEIDSGSDDDIDDLEPQGGGFDSSAAISIKREKARRATQDRIMEEVDED